MTTEKLNEILGDRLGRNLLNEPLYKWVHSEKFFHLMKTGMEEVIQPSGLSIMEPVFTERKMTDLVDTWLIAHWNDTISRDQWEALYGLNLLWPRGGYYTPANITLRQGVAPTPANTEYVIARVKFHRGHSLADFLQDGDDIISHREKSEKSVRDSIIDDACTAFGNDPGKRNGDVSFPSTSSQITI